MTDLDFNLSLSKDSIFVRTLHEAKKTDLRTGRQHLQQAYETTSGIFDHLAHAFMDDAQTNPGLKRPLAAVALHPAEDTTTVSLKRERFRQFKDAKVYATTGMSWDVFLEQPREMVEFILEECRADLVRAGKVTDGVLAELNGHLPSSK